MRRNRPDHRPRRSRARHVRPGPRCHEDPGFLRPELVAVLHEEFGDDPLALRLFRDFLGPNVAIAERVGRLVDVARTAGTPACWPLRRAAVLMLESILLATPADDPGGFAAVLRTIAEGSSGSLVFPPGPSVLEEGYMTTDPTGFAAELRARLSRHERIHRALDGPATTPVALRDFLDLARHEPRLTLARYFFAPAEVAQRILAQVRTSRGLTAPFRDPLVADEAETLVGEFPEYERTMLRELLAGSHVYWVDDATPSRIHALVEYPHGTVVLVVKPPGSDLEFELKRAGRRGDTPLTVVYAREGERVCSGHRLDGGSMAPNLRAEAEGAAAFGRIFRLVHGRRAPVSVTLAHVNIHEVPHRDGRADLLDFFTDPDVFGPGFDAMRDALLRSIPSFSAEWDADPLDAPGDLGATIAFLGQVNPTQAVLGPTSSFRLDLVASYLADDGSDRYFRRALGIAYSPDDSRRFAAALLDEVLGCVNPVPASARDHASYLDAAFADPANRRRADAIFLDLAAQAGEVWGTLFALKGFSFGESFVGRNVGLRCVWERAAWRVRLVFMDHDLLIIPRDGFHPARALWGLSVDAAHIAFDPASGRRSELELLSDIYRTTTETTALGRASFLRAARSSYRLTRSALANDPQVRVLYRDDVLTLLLDWDDALAAYALARQRGLAVDEALTAGSALLLDRGHESEAAGFADSVGRRDDFLSRVASLFGDEPPSEITTTRVPRRSRK